MKPNWFLRILSYFYDIPIEKRHSDYSGTLEVSLHRGEWKLSTFNAIYSFGKHYTSYEKAFKQLDIQLFPAKNILILGVGIGSVVRLLEKHPTIQSITAVDIDEAIIELAKKYWPVTFQKIKTTFIVQDALDWLEQSTQAHQYDLIISDVFIDDKTPENMLGTKYLKAIKRMLSTKGILIYSKLHYSEQNKEDNIQFEKTFLKIFPLGFSILAQYNKMYIHQS
ncbi:MAG: methyltransferase domain-containing protein [Chitinophagales bacterium]|nr:methyltransferase domain-containing protein [Chitinophagales bacterium]